MQKIINQYMKLPISRYDGCVFMLINISQDLKDIRCLDTI